MNKKIIAVLVSVFLVVLYFYYMQLPPKLQPVETSLPTSEQKARVERVNDWLDKLQTEREVYEQIKDTPEEKAKSNKYWDKMRVITQAQLEDIEFYGVIVDQHGDPIPLVEIRYNAQSGYMAKGTGHQTTRADLDGRFVIKGVVGAGLSVNEMYQPAYVFELDHVKDFDNHQRFPDSQLWAEYSNSDTPYVFKGWKIEDYGRIEKELVRYYFYPDGREYSIDLTNKKKQKYDGAGHGSFDVSFTRKKENWQLTLSAPNGGFFESDDVYMNLAPEEGYQETVVLEDTYHRKRLVLKKQYYLKSQSGEYARVIMEIRPYFNKEKSFIKMDYSINLSGTRGLAKPEIKRKRYKGL